MTRPRLPSPALMLVADTSRASGRRLEAVVQAAVAGGVTIVQLRARALPHAERVALARRLREATEGRALLLVNDDIAAAVDSRADGVHLPEASDALAEARRAAGGSLLVSRAVHSLEAAVAAGRDGADLLVLGNVYATPSHPGRPGLGPDGVRAVCAAVRVPVVAIGGVTAAAAGELVRAGAAGIAVVGAIFDAPDAREAAAALRAALAAPVRA